MTELAPETLQIDELDFLVRRSDRRRTIGVGIERDGSLVIAAPTDCPVSTLEQLALTKRPWIYTKLAERDLLVRPIREKEFVNGEGFFYFGRSYRLLLYDAPDSTPPLRLHQGRFLLRRDVLSVARQHFLVWYTAHGLPWLQSRIARFADRIGVSPAGVEIRDVGFRWGSCAPDGCLSFHWRTVLLPPRIVEYVVVHELVHLCQPHHDPDFWRRLERTMPDFSERKRWLAENGSRYY